MIPVPRRPNPEPSSAPGSLFPSTLKLPKQLTFSGKDATPFWSPDGNHIAFLSLRNTRNTNVSVLQYELWVMEKDGSHQRPILSIDDLDEAIISSKVSWAKNSYEMLVSFTFNTGEIWKVNLDGNISKWSSMYDRINFQSYSFDGSKIAFLVQDADISLSQGPVSRLYIADSDYSEHIFIDEGIFYYDVAWENDSDGLIYSKNHDLWEYSISENEKAQLSTTPEHEERPSCSSDGKYIAFSV